MGGSWMADDQRRQHRAEVIKAAVEYIQQTGLPACRVCTMFDIPQATLYRHLTKANKQQHQGGGGDPNAPTQEHVTPATMETDPPLSGIPRRVPHHEEGQTHCEQIAERTRQSQQSSVSSDDGADLMDATSQASVTEDVEEKLLVSTSQASVTEEVEEKPLVSTSQASVTEEEVEGKPLVSTSQASVTEEEVEEKPLVSTSQASVTEEEVEGKPLVSTSQAIVTEEEVEEKPLVSTPTPDPTPSLPPMVSPSTPTPVPPSSTPTLTPMASPSIPTLTPPAHITTSTSTSTSPVGPTLCVPSMASNFPPRIHVSIPPISPKFKPEDLPPDTKAEDVARLTERHVLERVPPTEKKKYPSKRCKVCLRRSGYTPGPARKHPKESVYYCPQCPSKPGLCCYPCYYVYHSKLNFWEPDEEEEGGEGRGGGGRAVRYMDEGSGGYGPGTSGLGRMSGKDYMGLGAGYSGGLGGLGVGGLGISTQASSIIGQAMQMGSGTLYGGEVIDVEEEQEQKFCPVPMYGESLYGPGGQ
ncbi:hypothetical protein ACOMHN_007465 [Nucella lapillus]